MHIVGRCLPADEDDTPTRFGHFDHGFRSGGDLTRRYPGRSPEAGRCRLGIGKLVDNRQRRVLQEGRHPFDCRGASKRKAFVLGHLNRDPERRLWAAFGDPRLQHPQPALFDGELDVADIGVMALEQIGVSAQLLGFLRHPLVECGDAFGLVRPGYHVLALRLEHDVAVEARLSGGGVSGEDHTGCRVGAPVPEDHRLDRDRRPQVVVDALVSAVAASPIAVPGAKDSLDCAPELLPGIIRNQVDADDVSVHRRQAVATGIDKGVVPR